MAQLSLNDIQLIVEQLAAMIDAPASCLPTYGYSKDGAWPHIEVEGVLMHYVVVERGHEWDRRSTLEINNLLYWIFKSVTFEMSVAFELKNRIEDKDGRRIIFKKQEELLGVLNKKWQQKQEQDHIEILAGAPFDNLASLRATYCGELRKQGYPEEEIKRIAYKEYPKHIDEK